MYRFFKIYLQLMILPAILLAISFNPAFAAENFSLKPIRPPIFNRLTRLLEKAQRSHLLQHIDALLSLSGFYELATAVCRPAITIIPPIGTPCNEPTKNRSIKVLSANLLLFPTPFFFNQQQRIEEFTDCVRTLNPDIIFMQEVWDNHSLALLMAAMSDYHAIYSPGIGYNYSGLLTLSRFAPRNAEVRRFAPSLRHSLEEFIAQKSILIVELNAEGQPLYLLNTHLYSAAPYKSYRPNIEQFRRVTEITRTLPGRIILGGDINLRPEELEKMLPANLQRDDCNLPTAGYPRLSQKLDYIIAGNTSGHTRIAGKRVDPPRRFSDHNPIFSEISFTD